MNERFAPGLSTTLLLILAMAVTSGTIAHGEAGDGPSSTKPLIAHWTFDETFGDVCHDASRQGHDATLHGGIRWLVPGRQPTPLKRIPSVFGTALYLAGEYNLQTRAGLCSGSIDKLTLSAWVQPSDLPGFREIIRQECEQRVLFSFQENGAILSLGLNISGYVECDGSIDPAKVLDGRWHHCAATFDGRHMRVYLDGREIGRLERPGTIASNGTVPFFIGSSSGTGEHFQGGLDDLRVYGDALTAEEIRTLYRSGSDRAEQVFQALQARAGAICGPADSFANMLARCRNAALEKDGGLNLELLDAALAVLRRTFPDESRRFTTWTGAGLPQYVTTRGNGPLIEQAARLIELMTEYKPLTEHQWSKQTDEDRKKWKEADELQRRFEELKAQGDAAAGSPQWVELILQVGSRVQLRPYVQEPVAPYVRPSTPPTRDLPANEAEETLRRDWLHQADGSPTPQRIRDEVTWTRRLAARIQLQWPGRVDLTGDLVRLADLEKRAASLPGNDPELYFEVRRVKRSIQFHNPAVDFGKVLFVDMPYPQGSEWRHETRHRLGYMAVPGARLLVLDGLSPSGKLTQLMPQPPLHGSFWRPDLSYDADKVLFCYKPHNEKSFHLYEINVDGSGLVQLTDGAYDDLDPIYLPDDRHIVFTTTRGHTYVRCMPPTNAFVLARCDRSGREVYLISQNNEPDYLPSVTHEGRVLYTRWEYTDKPLWRAQKLWTVNPDGMQVNTLWGNQSVWPDVMKDARCIPGSRRILFTGSAHHDWFAGSLAILDPAQGLNFPQGLTKITADVPWPETGNGPVDPIESRDYHCSGKYPAYYSPYPLSEQDFLVSANRGGKFLLYLMDVEGNRELIYEGVHNILHALPVKPRPRPPIIPDHVAWPGRADRSSPKGGVLFSNDVYRGAPPELKDKARYLRILHIEPKTYTYWHKRPYISTGPVVSIVQSEGVKRVLGTVPIDPDGSLSFHAPSGMPLHFQLLDEDQRALQTMRSFVGLMPGEYRGCLGCHEAHARTPVNTARGTAVTREPLQITPPPWGEDTVSYARYAKPVFDRYCGQCHQGDGEGRKVLDLTDRPGFLGFSEPYVILTGHPSWGEPYRKPREPSPGWGLAGMLMVEAFSTIDPAGYKTPAPMTGLSYKSRLIDYASSGKHHNVRVDPISLQRLIAWVDAMCPYLGDEEVRQIPDPQFQGVDWLAVRPRIATAPRITRPGPVD
ncbi:MAG TPA: hypothetical protein P5159_21555 [Phycisphaerae bacterium]|nr:hypothetical protein [Phycisphaerae bacterium]HSA29127.1 hypothetical protein [Phycisphaerae bacterium]